MYFILIVLETDPAEFEDRHRYVPALDFVKKKSKVFELNSLSMSSK